MQYDACAPDGPDFCLSYLTVRARAKNGKAPKQAAPSQAASRQASLSRPSCINANITGCPNRALTRV